MYIQPSRMKIDKLSEYSFHTLKHHILVFLSLKELDEYVYEESTSPGNKKYIN